tara:strand:- start:652 stop:837 length:186 start_codon:yes stop_codon:yes gene_type:complete
MHIVRNIDIKDNATNSWGMAQEILEEERFKKKEREIKEMLKKGDSPFIKGMLDEEPEVLSE